MRNILLPLLIAALPVTASAGGIYSGAKFLNVNPISNTTFEVIDGPDATPTAYWCTAAHHVENTLGRQQSRIYLSIGRGPSQTAPGRKAVQFSTEPVGNVGQTITISVRQVGANLSSGHALRLCDDNSISDNDR